MAVVGVARATDRASGVRLSEIVAAISLAADLGLGQPMEHVLRSCLIAVGFAEHLDVTEEELEATYWVTLLVTAGCTGVSFELARLFGDDIALRSGFHGSGPSTLAQLRYFLGRAGSDRQPLARARLRADLLRTGMSAVEQSLHAHCHVSGRLGDRVGLGPAVSAALAQTFARWDGKGLPRGLGGEDIALPMRICQISDAVEVWHREAGVDGALVQVRRAAGRGFDPDLAAAWCTLAPDVLGAVTEGSAWDAVIAAEPRRRGPLTEGELDSALEVVADFADLKSPWFSGHSRAVADLAATAARVAGLPESEATALRRAGLLHDLGRSGVPNSIWDKPGPLTDAERERVRLHPYYTDRVVRRAGSLAWLAPVASAAQERWDGTGYPRAVAGETIPLLGRFLAAADCYRAMVEHRPHRPGLPREAAAREMRELARSGRLNGPAVDAVLSAAGHPARRRPTVPGGLTPREIEVLTLVARGATLREVGARLDITSKTAGNHVERIYAKIGVSSRAEAAMFAMQHQLLPTA